MKMSTKGRYAVMAMIDIATHSDGEPVSLAEIAERQDISQEYLEQLFGKLRWRGDGGQSDLQLSLALANNRLYGTQGLPQDMLADRKSAYTWPDRTANTMGLLILNGIFWLVLRPMQRRASREAFRELGFDPATASGGSL